MQTRLDKALDEKRKFNDEMVGLIDEIKEDWGWGAWPMRLLYQNIYRSLCAENDLKSCLSILLRIRYAVEINQIPKTLGDKVETMRLICAVMGIIYRVRYSKAMGDIGGMVDDVYVRIRADTLLEIERCYGSNSSLARWDRTRYLQEAAPLWKPPRHEYQSALLRFLKWSGVDPIPTTVIAHAPPDLEPQHL